MAKSISSLFDGDGPSVKSRTNDHPDVVVMHHLPNEPGPVVGIFLHDEGRLALYVGANVRCRGDVREDMLLAMYGWRGTS